MFGKKKCSHCDRKVDKNFDFCPYCANPMKNQNSKDYGILGKSDDLNELDNVFKHSFASTGFGGSFMEKMMASAMKMVEKEVRKMNEEEIKTQNNLQNNTNQNMKTNFELFINGKKVPLPGNIAGIQIEKMPSGGMPNNSQSQAKPKQAKMPKVSEETIEKSKKLPRKEAKSKLTRTANKVIYELDTPGLTSLNNVLVSKLENSIEIKAFTEKAVLFKTLQVKLPLMQYSIKPEEGKLVLEFKAG